MGTEENQPPRGNLIIEGLKTGFVFIVLLIIVAASFWISFQLGRRIFSPARKFSDQRINVPVPEPPPSIKSLQKLGVNVSGESTSVKGSLQPISVSAVDVKPVAEKMAASPVKAKPVKKNKTVGGKSSYYKVQAGVFPKRDQALIQAAKVNALGEDVYVRKTSAGWRVQVGAFKTKGEAQALQAELKEKGVVTQTIVE